MKTLKITLALIAIVVLTVSGVQSSETASVEDNNIHQPTKIDVLAHAKKKVLVPSNG